MRPLPKTRIRSATTTSATEPGSVAPLAMDGIGFSIGGRDILRDVSLAVQPHEVVCLLGQSGCGKTTLLRIAAGIEEQTAGSVHVGGKLMADSTTFAPAERRPLGLVFQDLALFPHMSVADNICYGLTRAKRRATDVNEALAQVGLHGFGRKFPHQLSGGEQQRVALLRALLPEPAVLLLDEPFSGLDLNMRDAVREDVLRLLRARGATAVMVTHDPQEALVSADRIVLMRKGEIVQTATPEEIWRWPADLVAARMFGPVNAFSGRVLGNTLETPLGRIPVGTMEDGTHITVAFRPESLAVTPEDRGEGVAAAVVDRRFFGGFVEISVALPGMSDPVVLRADPYAVPHTKTVKIVPDLRQAIVLRGEQLP